MKLLTRIKILILYLHCLGIWCLFWVIKESLKIFVLHEITFGTISSLLIQSGGFIYAIISIKRTFVLRREVRSSDKIREYLEALKELAEGINQRETVVERIKTEEEYNLAVTKLNWLVEQNNLSEKDIADIKKLQVSIDLYEDFDRIDSSRLN